MKHSLRRRLSHYLVLSALLAAVSASIGLWVYGEYYFRAFYASLERAGLENARARIELFDIVMARAEQDIEEPGRRALFALGERFASADRVQAIGSGELKALAEKLGVDDVYFIDRDGRVFASSLTDDIGLDLFSLGDRFSDSLKSLYGRGTVGAQRLSQAIRTGVPTVYQYYGPLGRDFLIEVSTRIDASVSQLYPQYGYKGLAQVAFNPEYAGPDAGKYVRLVDLVGQTGETLWSLIGIGERRDQYAGMAARAYISEPARMTRGGIETVVVSVPLEARGTDVVHDKRFAIIEIDRRPLWRYRTFTLVLLLASCCAAIGLTVVIADRGFGREMASRMERLERSIARTADRAAPFDFADGCDDEISSIGRSVDTLARQVRARAEEREVLNARLGSELGRRAELERELASALAEKRVLRREVHHRVKNNMQIVLSLIGLQTDGLPAAAESRACDTMRTRLYAMSLVLDRLYSREDIERLPLDDFLHDFCYYLEGMHRRPDFFATIRSDGDGLCLAADSAVPVGLVIGELLTNSLRHAFPGRGTGTVEVRAEKDGAGFVLTVRDDGIGGDAAAQGVGILIVRALAAQLGAALDVEAGEGRTVRLRIPGGVAL